MTLAKTLLALGSPSHRIQAQLESTSSKLQLQLEYMHLPNLIILSYMDSETHTNQTKFIRAGSRISLTPIHKVHLVYRDVLHGELSVVPATRMLRAILKANPIYPVWLRCLCAFLCSSIICSTAFGGSIIDMFISGLSASTLQYLNLQTGSKSSTHPNVYE